MYHVPCIVYHVPYIILYMFINKLEWGCDMHETKRKERMYVYLYMYMDI